MKWFTKLKYGLAVFILAGNFSCADWLDLGSEDRIMEKDLFGTKEGFATALNGVYIELMDARLYGATLTFRTFDVLAQYYNCDKADHVYQLLAQYQVEAKNGQVSGLWTHGWYLLNNINTIIEHCDADKAVLGETDYHVMKGEALALRGLLHFEMLRVFGPIYSIDRDQKCIPYSRSSELVVLELLPASKIGELIMADLRAAEKLLEGYDPVTTEGVRFSDAGNGLSNDMRYRSMRLNYYAVQAYIARLAIYIGDTPLAAEYAEKVIQNTQEKNNWFPFVTRKAALDPVYKDRIYQSEILFGLYNLKRKDIFDYTFSNKLSNNGVLRPTDTYISWMYDDDLNDWRYTEQWESMADPDDNAVFQKYFIKYMEQDDNGEGFRYIIPLMRISEMYLIAAECDDDKDRQWVYLNRLRNARGLADAEKDGNIMEFIEKEYRREFIGEGQLFWFFKRCNQNSIIAGNETSVPMSKDYYLFQLPQGELDHRGND